MRVRRMNRTARATATRAPISTMMSSMATYPGSSVSWTSCGRRGSLRARVLHARAQLVAHLAHNTRCELVTVLVQVTFHPARFLLCELAQRPRQGLHHHVVAVVAQIIADGEGAFGITLSAARRVIEWHSTHQRGAPPPAVIGCRPAAQIVQRQLTLTKGRPRDITGKSIDIAPVVYAFTQGFHVVDCEQLESRMMIDELPGKP